MDEIQYMTKYWHLYRAEEFLNYLERYAQEDAGEKDSSWTNLMVYNGNTMNVMEHVAEQHIWFKRFHPNDHRSLEAIDEPLKIFMQHAHEILDKVQEISHGEKSFDPQEIFAPRVKQLRVDFDNFKSLLIKIRESL